MEVVIPLFALSSLYLINNQSKKSNHDESFRNRGEPLPNTDIPNRNYPSEYPVISDTDLTSELSNNNKFDNGGGVYTDRFFSPNSEIGTASSSKNDQYYSMTGQKVDQGYFQHNNMVPYFGSHLRSQHVNSSVSESILDNYSGAGSQIITKKEQSPLFAPHDNLQWANGTPNQTSFIQSRMNPSQRMANVKPFAEQTVAPGLGLGYTTEGSGGFNSGMMMREKWLDKTVDELRVNNKPRASGYTLLGHEGPANSAIKYVATQEQMGIMEKHLPDQSFELGQDRLFTTTGIQKGETLRSIPVDRNNTSRQENTMEYAGIAGYQNSSSYIPGEYMPSHNQQFGEIPMAPANAGGRFYANDADYGIKSKMAYPNNRTANHQDGYFGLVSGGLNAAIAPLLDILRPSRRENVIGTLRPYQNPGSTVSNSYIFNPADRPAPTIRETTENSKFHLNVNSNQMGGAYKVSEQQVKDTYRQETSTDYVGIASAGDRARQTTSYESNYNQRNNDIKSSTIDGRMVAGNMSLMNGDINMRQQTRDELLQNKRHVTGNMPYQAPDITTMGRVAGNGNGLYSNIQLDRNTPDITNMLKSNPFVVDYKNRL